MEDYVDKVVPEHWKAQFGWHNLCDDQKKVIADYGLASWSLGRHTTSEIDEVKYEGRLIILEDGGRWDVEQGDEDEAESWDVLDKVVIIDDEMYNIENAPKVSVVEAD